MSDTVWIALIGAVVAIVAGGMPWIMARQAAATRADEREADNNRQDEIAARVKEAAEATQAVSVTLAATTKIANDKLDALHEQGNSNLKIAQALALRAGLAEGNIQGRQDQTKERQAEAAIIAPAAPISPVAVPTAVIVSGALGITKEDDKK